MKLKGKKVSVVSEISLIYAVNYFIQIWSNSKIGTKSMKTGNHFI